MSDTKHILSEVAKGNEVAFRALYRAYKDNIYYTAFRLSNDEYVAEEVLQETFILIWKKREKLIEVRNFDAWAYRIAKNVFLSRLRQHVIPTETLDAYIHDLRDGQLSRESAEYKELEYHFEKAIAALPEKQRLTYQFIKNEGLSRKQVAVMLKVSPETVKYNYEQANEKVRNHLIKYLNDIPLAVILIFLLKRLL